jgi:hypothetical protein
MGVSVVLSVKVCRFVGNGATEEPLVFANVLVQGTQQGTVTDDHDRFAINLAAGDSSH